MLSGYNLATHTFSSNMVLKNFKVSGRSMLFRLYSFRPSETPSPVRQSIREVPKMTTLPNGTIIVSAENGSAVARLAVVFKAGSRYEEYNEFGVTHYLRHCIGLKTRAFTPFRITRELQSLGAETSCSVTREYMIYKLKCNRALIQPAIKLWNSMICEPAFKPWEITPIHEKIKIELEALRYNSSALTLDNLHKVAFRKGLGNSIYCPERMMGKHYPRTLSHFMSKTFGPDRMVFSAVGLSHQEACDYANQIKCGNTPTVVDQPTQYSGGEIRVDRVLPHAFVAIVANSIGTANAKDALSTLVLQQLLGVSAQVKRGIPPTRLARATANLTTNPFSVTCLNYCYSDGGLFGFYIIGVAQDMPRLISCLIEEVNVVKAGVSDEDVQIAKQRAISAIQMEMEKAEDMVEQMAFMAFEKNKIVDAPEAEQIIQNITTSDINSIVKRVADGKPSMSAVGNLMQTPYLDEIPVPK